MYMDRVGVVDYAAGNLTSVETALKRLGADFAVSGLPDELDRTERLIFPGVGEARAAMRELEKRRLDGFLRRYVASGRPVLGICIGCQIVLSLSEENETPCLDIVPGRVRRFPYDMGLKVPHMGWNEVRQRGVSPLFDGIPDGSSFYFVHSYYPQPERQEETIGTTDYGIEFVSAFSRNNLYAVQFHPEKSGELGIRLLSNFLSIGTEGTVDTDGAGGGV